MAEQPTIWDFTGQSMLPAIFPRAQLEVTRVTPEEVERGDVVCFIGADKRIVAHRVLDIDPSRSGVRFTVRGDAQFRTERLEPDAVATKVVRVIGPLGSYRTAGTLGRVLRELALRNELRYALVRRALVESTARFSLLPRVWKRARAWLHP